MKKIILIVFVLLQIQINAQTYIPFPTDSAQWSVRKTVGEPFSQTSFQYKMKGDTILNGLTYSKIYYSLDLAYNSPNQTLHCFIREDTTKKVFVKYPIESDIDTTEFMLYDFDLQVGDTTIVKLFYPTDSVFKLIVTNIDSNFFSNGYRKIIGLTPIDINTWGGGCDVSFSWTDGMGCNIGGLLYNEFPVSACFNYGLDLVCFWNKDTYVFGGTFCDYTTSINEPQVNNTYIQFFPNPANDKLNIYLSHSNTRKATVKIYDFTGRLIDQLFLNDNVPYIYNTSSLTPSIYNVSLYINEQLTETHKLVIIK